MLYDTVHCECSVALFEFTMLIPTPLTYSLPASYQLGVHFFPLIFHSDLHILIFIDFSDLEKILTKSAEGLEVIR